MITGELKNKVDRIWEMFWTGGITNPLDVIEPISYPHPQGILTEINALELEIMDELKKLGVLIDG